MLKAFSQAGWHDFEGKAGAANLKSLAGDFLDFEGQAALTLEFEGGFKS
jgi:hypothetical protein